jgi:hypothetical protein
MGRLARLERGAHLPHDPRVHGIVFVALQRHLTERGDPALGECFPDPGAYVGIGDYPDADFLRIAARLSRTPARPLDDTLRSLGGSMPELVRRVTPGALPRPPSFEALLDQLALDDGRGGILPRCAVKKRGDGLVSLVYLGDAELCRYAEGFLTGMAASAGESVAFRHPSCRRRDDPDCVMIARLLRSQSTARMRAVGKRGDRG